VRDQVVKAFLAVRQHYPSDRVVADPELNQRFLEHCRLLGLSQSPYCLNKCLFNARKAGHLTGTPRSSKTSFANEDEYRFASEMAARFLERKHDTTLDDIICNPEITFEFDMLAARISPGFSPFQYRWAALNIRKAKGFQPELTSRVIEPEEIHTAPINGLDIEQIPKRQGLYLLYQPTHMLYIGETKHLHRRIAKHLEHSDNKGVAHWLWEHGTADLFLEYHVLPLGTSKRVRRVLELELIRSRKPVFNIQGQ